MQIGKNSYQEGFEAEQTGQVDQSRLVDREYLRGTIAAKHVKLLTTHQLPCAVDRLAGRMFYPSGGIAVAASV